jgi:dihydromonapterin reductase/dihydrofolate reductase
MSERLEQAVLISGGTQRVGLYLVQRFLQARRYPVVFTYRQERAEVAALKAQGALGFQVDFLQPDAVSDLMQRVQERVASLRALIHNASLWTPDAALTEADFDALYRVHMMTPFQLNQACYRLFSANQTGLRDIISISDDALCYGSADYSAYLATKAGLQSLSRSFAAKYAPLIKVNDIQPGLIMFHPQDTDCYRQARLAKTALAIEPGPDVVWQAVGFLMDNPYVTGTVLKLDGGRGVLG